MEITTAQLTTIGETHGLFAASLRRSLIETTGVEFAVEVETTRPMVREWAKSHQPYLQDMLGNLKGYQD